MTQNSDLLGFGVAASVLKLEKSQLLGEKRKAWVKIKKQKFVVFPLNQSKHSVSYDNVTKHQWKYWIPIFPLTPIEHMEIYETLQSVPKYWLVLTPITNVLCDIFMDSRVDTVNLLD